MEDFTNLWYFRDQKGTSARYSSKFKKYSAWPCFCWTFFQVETEQLAGPKPQVLDGLWTMRLPSLSCVSHQESRVSSSIISPRLLDALVLHPLDSARYPTGRRPRQENSVLSAEFPCLISWLTSWWSFKCGCGRGQTDKGWWRIRCLSQAGFFKWRYRNGLNSFGFCQGWSSILLLQLAFHCLFNHTPWSGHLRGTW